MRLVEDELAESFLKDSKRPKTGNLNHTLLREDQRCEAWTVYRMVPTANGEEPTREGEHILMDVNADGNARD